MNLQINIPKPKYAMGNTVSIQNKEYGIITYYLEGLLK